MLNGVLHSYQLAKSGRFDVLEGRSVLNVTSYRAFFSLFGRFDGVGGYSRSLRADRDARSASFDAVLDKISATGVRPVLPDAVVSDWSWGSGSLRIEQLGLSVLALRSNVFGRLRTVRRVSGCSSPSSRFCIASTSR